VAVRARGAARPPSTSGCRTWRRIVVSVNLSPWATAPARIKSMTAALCGDVNAGRFRLIMRTRVADRPLVRPCGVVESDVSPARRPRASPVGFPYE
jgi:hypothetical protein